MDPLLILVASAALHGWDADRESAYAASDPAALAALYEPGSRAGRADVRLLRSYTARGLVVRRLVTQVLELSVVSSSSRSLELRVVDRVAGGVIGSLRSEERASTSGFLRSEERASRRTLGTTAPALRVITLRRSGEEWRVLSVREPGPRAAPSARPGR